MFIVIILLPVFLVRKSIQSSLNLKQHWTLVLIASVAFLFISAKSYRHLPFIDFRPYNIGSYIPDGMSMPEGAPTDSFAYSLIYKKGDIFKEFSLEEITAFVFLAISYSLQKASEVGLEKLKTSYEYSQLNKYRFYLATSSTTEEVEFYKTEFKLPFNFYTADNIMLKTVVRANPGLVLLKNGIIIKK